MKPKSCFKDSIHWPGLGKKFTNDGKIAIKKYGKAKPIAKDKNTKYE
jgi:hypothetical protein